MLRLVPLPALLEERNTAKTVQKDLRETVMVLAERRGIHERSVSLRDGGLYAGGKDLH